MINMGVSGSGDHAKMIPAVRRMTPIAKGQLIVD
jgi:ABC-type proline/glycine betaine transport system ATPase subunit